MTLVVISGVSASGKSTVARLLAERFERGVTGGQSLEISGLFSVPLAEIAAATRPPLPALFG